MESLTTEENLNKIRKMVLADRRVKLSRLAEAVSIATKSGCLILRDKLNVNSDAMGAVHFAH